MANQMIALQARNPQLPDPSRAAAQYANMMNMASQQRASQLQGERIRQEMDIEAAKEKRAAETQVLDIRGKQLDNEDKELARLYKMGAAILETEDPTAREAAYQNLLGLIETTSSQLGATMRQVASTFNPNVLQAAMMKTEQYFNKKYATPIASLELREDGTPVSVQVGGLNPEQRPVFDAVETPMAAPRATPTAPTNPMSRNAPAPNAAGEAPGSLGLVVASALQTGVMAKSDFDKMLSLAAPESRAKIAAWAQQNNIQVTPNVPGVTDNQMRGAAADFQAAPMSYDGRTPESQFAVYRGQPMQAQTAGLAGAPEMQQTLAQTQPRTATKLQQRNPNVSPYPGSAQVPIERVRQEAVAGRETPAEAADKTRATEKAKIAVGIEEENRIKTRGRKLFSNVLNDLRKDYRTLNELKAIPSTKRGSFENIGDYIGSSMVGRIGQNAVGTKASVPLNNISNSKLTLMNALKEATNLSATQLSSNVELMTFLDSLSDPTQGFESAMETIRRLENLYGAPSAASGGVAARKTPTTGAGGWGKAKVVGN